MKRFEKILTRTLEFSLAFCLLAMTTIVVALVVLRHVFHESITGANELVTILFVYTTAVGAAVAIGRRDHIAIPLAVEALSARGQKFATVVELILVAILNAVLLGFSIGWIRITGDYLMPATGLPRIVAQASVPFGCGLAIIYCLLRLVSSDSEMGDVADAGSTIHSTGGDAE
ncbi:MAG: TRAP transporter small permease [Aeoliella sp.]